MPCSAFPRFWNSLHQSYFPCTCYEEYFLLTSLTHKRGDMSAQMKSMCKDVSLILPMKRHTIPGISLKKTGGTFTSWIPVVSRIQRIISTQATERDSGVVRIFQDGYFLLHWVSTSFHHFPAAATIIKKGEKESNCLEIFVHMWYWFLFSLYCIPHCKKQWYSLVCSLCFLEPPGEVLICIQILPVKPHRAKPHSTVIKSDKKPRQTRANRWCASYDNL